MKLILFDVDGTLIDSRSIILAAQRAAFAAHGITPPSQERSLSVVGLSLRELFRVLVEPGGPVDSLTLAYKEAFAAFRTEPTYTEPVFPGMANLVERLAARHDVVLGIATGKSRRGVRHILERHRWTSHFATIQTSDDAPSKPHPAMIRQAMDEAGIVPEATVIVGDSSFDMAMGRAAGVLPIGVAWGFQPVDALREAGAALIVEDAWMLGAALDRFLDASRPAPVVPISSP